MNETNKRKSSPGPQALGGAHSLSRPTIERARPLGRLVVLPLLLALSLLAAGCFESKVVTTKLNDPEQNRNNKMHGVFYALPRTIVKASVPVVKTELKNGFYKQFAQCFFPGEKILDKGVEFAIDTDNVKFEKLAIPDPDQVYVIKTQGNMFETRNLELSLTESGVFVKGVAESENQSLDLLTSTVKDVVGIAAKATTPGALLTMRGVNRKQVNTFRSQLTPAQDDCYSATVARLEAAELSLHLDSQSIERDLNAPQQPQPAPNDALPRKRSSRRTTSPALATSADKPATAAADSALAPATSANVDGQTETPEEQDAQREKQIEEARNRKELLLRQELQALNAGTRSAPVNDPQRALNLQKMLAELDAARKEEAAFKQAKAIYDRIMELEEKRDNLLGGSGFGTPLPNDTFTKMLAELDATIKAYKGKYFLGTKTQTPTVLSFRMDPGRTPSPKRLFRFSEAGGICGLEDNNQSAVVNPDFQAKAEAGKADPCADAQVVSLIVEQGDNGEGGSAGGPQLMSQRIAAAGMDQRGKRGFYYRVPGRGVARLVLSGSRQTGAGQHAPAETELGRDTLSIAQFGTTVSLPASTGGRRTKYTLELFESSGGMKNFIMGSDALVKQSNIKDITDTASTIVDTRNERREARRKANQPPDELSELERKRKILEEKKKIQDLEKEIGESGTSNSNSGP